MCVALALNKLIEGDEKERVVKCAGGCHVLGAAVAAVVAVVAVAVVVVDDVVAVAMLLLLLLLQQQLVGGVLKDVGNWSKT